MQVGTPHCLIVVVNNRGAGPFPFYPYALMTDFASTILFDGRIRRNGVYGVAILPCADPATERLALMQQGAFVDDIRTTCARSGLFKDSCGWKTEWALGSGWLELALANRANSDVTVSGKVCKTLRGREPVIDGNQMLFVVQWIRR